MTALFGPLVEQRTNQYLGVVSPTFSIRPLSLAFSLTIAACNPPGASSSLPSDSAPVQDATRDKSLQQSAEVELSNGERLEVSPVAEVEPPAGDAPPRETLRIKSSSGEIIVLEGAALAHTVHDGRVAYINQERVLRVREADGAVSLISERVSTRPAWSESGDLLYVVQHDEGASIHQRSAAGKDRILVESVAHAGVLAPQRDGSLFFVGATRGGVAGLWRVTSSGVQCLTNCSLRAGSPWEGKFVPPPGAASQIKTTGDQVSWLTPDGKTVSRRLPVKP